MTHSFMKMLLNNMLSMDLFGEEMYDTYLQVHPKRPRKAHTPNTELPLPVEGGEELIFAYWSLFELTCTTFKTKHFTVAFLNPQVEHLSCPGLRNDKLLTNKETEAQLGRGRALYVQSLLDVSFQMPL